MPRFIEVTEPTMAVTLPRLQNVANRLKCPPIVIQFFIQLQNLIDSIIILFSQPHVSHLPIAGTEGNINFLVSEICHLKPLSLLLLQFINNLVNIHLLAIAFDLE